MENELINFIKVWLIAIALAIYSYSLSKIFHIPKGLPRLFFILPVICLFLILPLSLSSLHLGGPTIFYLVWLGNFKLFLYSFDLGPLTTTHPNTPLPLLHFISIALLPIKIKDNDHHKPTSISSSNPKTKTYPFQNTPIHDDPHDPTRRKRTLKSLIFSGSTLLLCVKLLAFALVIKIYDYKQILPSFVIYANYFCHVYLGIELILAASATLAQSTLGLGLAQQFNEPYLTTSLQDFWAHRWNLMVSDILRLSVYQPIRRVTSPLVGHNWARVVAMIWAFTVSGLMHELMYFYCTRVGPTWEVTCFFVLHGVATAAEVAVKKAVVGGGFRLHRVVSGVLTIGFLGVTGVWLFLPQILRNGVHDKVIDEYPIMFDFVKQNVISLETRLFNI